MSGAVCVISGHEYCGKNLGSIVRREFGRRAGVRLAQPGSPHVGTVVEWAPAANAWAVLGVVTHLDGRLGDVEPRRRVRREWWTDGTPRADGVGDGDDGRDAGAYLEGAAR